ncbi:MAG: S-layer homology domain-containing protein [Chloroflexi bacterium]|nr:S-layer homology domain-containing protein [Chloroflexota bacterium]
MKTIKLNYLRGSLNFLMILGMIALLIMPGTAAQAQADTVSAPLVPALTWNDLGLAERAFSVNGESVTLTGTVYQASEKFNLDASDVVSAYYSSTNLAELGWRGLNTTPNPNGVSSLYFHADGVFALVEFVGCEENPSLSCLTVWQSVPTDVVPAQGDQFGPGPLATGSFNKSAPANGAVNIDTSATLSWTEYTGTGFNHYRYCFDTTNDSGCDNGWTSVWDGTSVTVSSFAGNTTYYWQVQAVLDDTSKVNANNGTWWSFTTKAATPPGAFTKTFPSSGATGQSATPVLVWQASSNAAEYSYCIDTTNNSLCDSNWISAGTNRYITLLSGIGANVTYYWQARATNSSGLTYGDGGTWASFTTATGPANDTIDSAAAVGIPYENNVSTIPATIDSDTTNACSTALGLSSVWYKYVTTASRKIYLDTFGSSYDTFIAVWTRNANGTLNPITCNDDSSGLTQSSINLSVTNGTTYYIQVAQKNPGTAPTAVPGGNLLFHVRNFGDVAGNNIFWKYIEGIYANGITGGCATSPDLLYCPASNVTRAEMAVFLLKSMHGASYTPPAVGTSTGFDDVSVSHWAAAWIKQLAAEGVTAGCSPSNYCPESQVTRAQMAVFLLRGEHGLSYTPPAVGTDTGFTDVAVDHWAAAWIKQLASEAITSGCAANLYCPESNVTREQMAVFLSKTFSIPTLP